MTKIPLGKQDYYRSVPREARIRMKNRFFEQNPILSNYTGSLISRPGARYYKTLGDGTGPIRKIYSSAGSFDDAVFVISNLSLYKITTASVATYIDNTTNAITNIPTMAATGFIGDGPGAIPEFLWITDSGNLWLYCEVPFATATLTFTGNAADTETVTIDDIVYKFTTGDVDTGTPAGTLTDPWLVALGATAAASIINLFKAINNTGVGGTDYSALLTTHTTVTASTYSATTLLVRSLTAGTTGDAIAVSEAIANATWSSTTLLGDYADGTLTLSANAADNDTVTINTTVYKFTSGSVDAGTPAGTGANPWLVALGGTTAISITNLYKAIGATGIAGTDYSTALAAHTTVAAAGYTTTTLTVRSIASGTTGNTYPTTETGANMVWGAATLTGGGDIDLIAVPLPTGAGALCVAYLGSYVFVVPEQGNDINGRFYWIRPGETTIDPLDYATAERSPDGINIAVVFSDRVWFCGNATTETWYQTGDADAPFERQQGVLFDRGCWSQTALQVKDSLIVVDIDGAVFQIAGGLKRISTPDIEERIRLAIQREA